MPGPASEVKTLLQAELMAILAAVHALNVNGSACIMTDSLCSLKLLAAHVARPDSLRHHKHCSLIAEIAQKLLSYTELVCLVKVRSHCGVKGNILADELAGSVHADSAVAEYDFMPRHPRGRAWVQVPFGYTISDADDLFDHLMTTAQKAYAASVSLSEASGSKALQHACRSHTASSGDLDVATSALKQTCHRQLSHRQQTQQPQLRQPAHPQQMQEQEAQAAAREAAAALLAQEEQAAQAAQHAKKAAKKAGRKLRKQVPDRHTQQCSCIHLCERLQRACGRKPTCCTAFLRLCCLSQQLKPYLEPRVRWCALCLNSVVPVLLQAARQGQTPDVQQQSSIDSSRSSPWLWHWCPQYLQIAP